VPYFPEHFIRMLIHCCTVQQINLFCYHQRVGGRWSRIAAQHSCQTNPQYRTDPDAANPVPDSDAVDSKYR
jgi:hypothetical protein